MNDGFSLLEIIIACIIIGILSVFAMPQFNMMKERSLDKEAQGYLSVLQAAERMYHTEKNAYYPSVGSNSSVANINSNLQVDLPASNQKWVYTVNASGNVSALRNKAGGRTWNLAINGDNSTCTNGATDSCL